jgi:hypothetical protein
MGCWDRIVVFRLCGRLPVFNRLLTDEISGNARKSISERFIRSRVFPVRFATVLFSAVSLLLANDVFFEISFRRDDRADVDGVRCLFYAVGGLGVFWYTPTNLGIEVFRRKLADYTVL